MFSWEKKLVKIMDRWLPELVFVLVTIIAVLIRRQGIWHVSFDYQNHFYTDAPGYLHTPFYGLLVRALSYIPDMPIRTMKYFICLFDFVAAAGCVVLLKQYLGEKLNKLSALTCYALLLISPLMVEYGLVWIHIDSICFSLVLLAWFCLKKEKYFLAGIFLGPACALQVQYLVFPIVAAIRTHRKHKYLKQTLSLCLLLTIAGNLLAAVLMQVSIPQALYMLVNWTFTDPATGHSFQSLLTWLLTMLQNYGYIIGILALLAAFCQRRRMIPYAAVHIALTLYIAQILQYGY